MVWFFFGLLLVHFSNRWQFVASNSGYYFLGRSRASFLQRAMFNPFDKRQHNVRFRRKLRTDESCFRQEEADEFKVWLFLDVDLQCLSVPWHSHGQLDRREVALKISRLTPYSVPGKSVYRLFFYSNNWAIHA